MRVYMHIYITHIITYIHILYIITEVAIIYARLSQVLKAEQHYSRCCASSFIFGVAYLTGSIAPILLLKPF